MNSPKPNKKNGKLKKVKIFFLIFFLVFSVSFLTFKPAYANMPVAETASVPSTVNILLDKIKGLLKKAWDKGGSALYQGLLKNALNTLAFEAANKLGSGMTGQKPMYEEKDWEDIFADTGNAAIGGFIDSIDQQWGVNVCEPDLAVKLKIGLGLTQYAKPPKPSCTWQDLQKNWETEKLKNTFLKSFSKTFEPTNSDLGMAFSLQTSMMETAELNKLAKEKETVAKKGWLDVRNIGGKTEAPPETASKEEKAAYEAKQKSIGNVTGDIFVDAANIFLNQLALTAYNGVMANLTEKGKSGVSSLANADADPNENSGAAGLRKSLSSILEPRFDSRGDYNILGELVSCGATPGGVGPTNCVINDAFSQAIQQKKTVGQALSDGSLSKDSPFGFQTSGASAIEPNYLEGIPYRSMIILRKFRIIPVGWELAAQYIRSNPDVRNNAYLGKMVECFSDNDSYEGYEEPWCKGLVDPDWVLKAPQNYCAKEGYGPQIIFQQAVAQGVEMITYEDKNGSGSFDAGEDKTGRGTSTVKVNNPPKLVVNRLDTYCADEQSCIKEKNDGSCEYYGYCTEERRKWNFGSNSCEPIYNSCQTFKGETGETASYLKNTLAFCGEGDFGCERYAKAATSSYVLASKKNDWTKNDGYAFFNKNIQSCEADAEGCHEFLRFRAGLGTNLIRNSGFEQNSVSNTLSGMGGGTNYLAVPALVSSIPEPYEFETVWPVHGSDISIVDNAPSRGGKVLYINSSFSPAGLQLPDRSTGKKSIFPKGFVMEPEVSYTLSADIYNVSADRVVLMIGRDGQYWEEEEINIKNSWVSRASVTIKNNKNILANEAMIFGFNSTGGRVELYIDNVKFEVGNQATAYNDYRQNNLTYQKFLPKYLEEICYVDWAKADYHLKTDAPTVCRQYARKCSRDEANCEMYSSTNGAKIPAAVTDKDYCTSECNGFDAYIQAKNNFNSLRTFYFIPKSSKQCSASEVGCEEFTNLDKSDQGGESREYYSYLRQCVKPNTPGNTCASFYTWEGNNEQGEQLSLHNLKAQSSGDVSLTSSDAGECNATVFNLSPLDPHYNPDCRRFTNQAGVQTYHLYSRTISCTDDCHPYRLSNKNVAERASVSQSACIYESAGTGHWDNNAKLCYYCENGGYWSVEHNSCIYNATPQESVACSSNAKGCSEFNGNQGNNVRQAFLSTFENGVDNWTWGASTPSTVSVAISGKKSLIFNNQIARDVSSLVVKDGSYTLSFVAKSASGASSFLRAAFVNDDPASIEFRANASSSATVEVKPNDWGIYKLNLASLNHEVRPSEKLVIYASGGGQVYIDNIRLSIISERYYLIRDSWNTPASCNQDENGKTYPLYMLGCSEYKDRLGNVHYLHRFSRLCQESAVGCEAIIDTQNSVRPSSDYYSTGNTLIPSDRVAYAVYDPEKKCQSADKGCERFGLAKEYENSYTFSDVFQKNDPDKYQATLCTAEGVGCDKWSSSNGDYYFKDPGDMVCEWRVGSVPGKSGQVFSWFKKKIKRCNGTDAVCSNNDECATGQNCKLDVRDFTCPTTQYKTFGQGGIGNEVYQPEPEAGFNWVGLCSADQSSCTEYVDPISDFSTNIIYNADFKQNIDNNDYADGWEAVTGSPTDNPGKQRIFLDGNNLYVLTVEGLNSASIDVSSAGATDFRPIYILRVDNTLSTPSISSFSVSASSSIVFYVDKNAEAIISVANRKVGSNDTRVSLKKVITDYQLSGKVDKNSCNGTANLSNGCVYFNERSIVGAQGYAAATINAWTGYGKKINTNLDVKNTNELIKVAADRVCNTWLSCKTYVKGEDNKPVCFDIAECNRLDQGGNCANFTVLKDNQIGNKTYNHLSSVAQENFDTIKNLSGYSKVGYEQTPSNKFTFLPNNLFNLGLMNQYGTEVKVSNGNFELNNKTLNGNEYVYTPAGWSPYASVLTPKDSSGMFDVIQDPVSAQKAGVAYPAEGIAFLRYNASNPDNVPLSDTVRISRGQEYYLSYRINTTGLISGSALVEILPRGISTPVDSFTTQSSMDWQVETYKFSSPTSDLINIRLGATPGSGGYVYIDDIKISPVLKIKELDDTYINQDCRLYPKEDSLSCDYYDDAGMRLKGDYGYCLEYDRAPGNPNTCLMWWPIDKVSGQGGGSAVKAATTAYSGPAPLFYCVGANTERPYIDAKNTWYAVDEVMTISVNGVDVTSAMGYGGSPSSQSGSMDSGLLSSPAIVDYVSKRVYLKYGENIIKVRVDSNNDTGVTYGLFGGYFHYWDNAGVEHVSTFNLTNKGTDRDVKLVSSPTGVGNADGRTPTNCELHLGTGSSVDFPAFFGGGSSSDGSNGDFLVTEDGNNNDGGECWHGGVKHDVSATFKIFIPQFSCSHIAQVVDRNGANKVWVERFKESSGYFADCNIKANPAYQKDVYGYAKAEAASTTAANLSGKCYYSADAYPFGSIMSPGNTEFEKTEPTTWGDLNAGVVDITNVPANKPLLYQSSVGGTKANMGQLYSKATLGYLFAESYGIWDWAPALGRYVINNNSPLAWESPTKLCNNNVRSAGKFENCSIRPDISNIKLNGETNAAIFGRGFVNVTFNSKVDAQQAPLTFYEVDWGDEEKLTVSGVDMKDMPNADNPHSAYHSYDYWDLYGKWTKAYNSGVYNKIPTIVCLPKGGSYPQDYCLVKPKVKIKDNWGWCSEGRDGFACPQPNTAACVNSDSNTNPALTAGKSYCRNYSASLNTTIAPQMCSDPAYPICSDGYWEASGNVVVYKY